MCRIYLFFQLLSLQDVRVSFTQHVLLMCQTLLFQNFREGIRVVTVSDCGIAGGQQIEPQLLVFI